MNVDDIPVFGSLSDVTVVFTGHTVAAPFAAELLAEHGARVICIEHTKRPDIARATPEPFGFLTEHRNQLFCALDFGTAQGKEAFVALLSRADVLIEGFVPGSFEQWGLDDNALWEINPQLVITHISGFGHTGIPEYVRRKSYDPIGQAFSGYMALNGYAPPAEPLRVNPYICDYTSAFFAVFGTLSALYAARVTGVGESVDVAQYESMLKLQYGYPLLYFATGEKRLRSGNDEPIAYALGLYTCKEGSIEVCVTAITPVKALIEVLGIADHPYFEQGTPHMLWRGDPAAAYVEACLVKYCAERTAKEVEAEFLAHDIPCSQVQDIAMLAQDVHVQAREALIEWEDERFGTLRGPGVFPKMKRRPGQVWDGAHDWGADTRDVLLWAGFSDDWIDAAFESGAARCAPDDGGYMVSDLAHAVTREVDNV